MTRTMEEKRDKMAYLALYYAIHGETDRSEKLRMAMRQLDGERELVPVSVPKRETAPVL